MEEYKQGFHDGKRTGGKTNKRYIENLLKTETQHLSNEEPLDYKMGGQDGFTDAVNGVIKSTVLQEKGGPNPTFGYPFQYKYHTMVNNYKTYPRIFCS